MVWFKDNKLQLDEVRVAWAFCILAAVVSYCEIF